MAAPPSRRKEDDKPTMASSFCSSSERNHGSIIKTLVRVLAFSACVQQGVTLAFLGERATLAPRGLKQGVPKSTALGLNAEVAKPVPRGLKQGVLKSTFLVLNAGGEGLTEMAITDDETSKVVESRKNIWRLSSRARRFSTRSRRFARLLWLRRRKGRPGLEKQLRDFLFTRARVFTQQGDLTTIYGFIPVLAQLFVLSGDFKCMELTDPKSAFSAGLEVLLETVQLQFFSVVLVGVSLSQLVVDTRENLSAENLLFGRDPFCLDLWFPIGFNARPGGARITFRRKDEADAKLTGAKNLFELLRFATKSEVERRRLQFFFTFQDETVALNDETADILLLGTMLPLLASIGAVAPYLAYMGVGVRDIQLGGTDLSELAQLNLRLASSQFAIAFAGVTLFVSAISQASPEVRSEFTNKRKAGVLAAETVKLVEDVQMPEVMRRTILSGVFGSALFLAFSIDGLGQAPTMEVTKRACSAVKDVGTQANGIVMASFGDTDKTTLQTKFDFYAKGTLGKIFPDET